MNRNQVIKSNIHKQQFIVLDSSVHAWTYDQQISIQDKLIQALFNLNIQISFQLVILVSSHQVCEHIKHLYLLNRGVTSNVESCNFKLTLNFLHQKMAKGDMGLCFSFQWAILVQWKLRPLLYEHLHCPDSPNQSCLLVIMKFGLDESTRREPKSCCLLVRWLVYSTCHNYQVITHFYSPGRDHEYTVVISQFAC